MTSDLDEKPITFQGLLTQAVFRKTETVKSDKLNFYIPEKWNYNEAI